MRPIVSYRRLSPWPRWPINAETRSDWIFFMVYDQSSQQVGGMWDNKSSCVAATMCALPSWVIQIRRQTASDQLSHWFNQLSCKPVKQKYVKNPHVKRLFTTVNIFPNTQTARWWSEWVSSFLMAHQHILGYLMPYRGMLDLHKRGVVEVITSTVLFCKNISSSYHYRPPECPRQTFIKYFWHWLTVSSRTNVTAQS